MMRPALLAAIAVLLAGPALAQTDDVDGVIATGTTVAPPMTTDQKIANILAPARQADAAEATGEIGPRQIHGSASVSVGSGGYRAASVAALIPIGETGTLGIAYAQSQGGRGYGYGPGFGAAGFGPGRRNGSSQALDLSLAFDASRKAEDCAPAFHNGSRPIEPLWATEMRGRSVCDAEAKR